MHIEVEGVEGRNPTNGCLSIKYQEARKCGGELIPKYKGRCVQGQRRLKPIPAS